jgi:prepilin-type N-terminal cleavage/methylation domain-containing protein
MKRKGFTLIELVVVMAIIAILSVLVIGAITVARRTSTETANRGTAKSIQTGLEAYYAKNKQYPATTGTVTFDAIVATGGALNGMVTTQGAQCTGVATTWKGGGYVAYSATGYTLYIANWACNAELENIQST